MVPRGSQDTASPGRGMLRSLLALDAIKQRQNTVFRVLVNLCWLNVDHLNRNT